MPDNVYKFRTVKHGDPEKKLKILPDSLPKAMTVLAFAALTALFAGRWLSRPCTRRVCSWRGLSKMSKYQPLSVVLRLPNVTLSQSKLEEELGCRVNRYERTDTLGAYAQVDIPDVDDMWTSSTAYLRSLGPRISRLRLDGAIGPPSLDIALRIPSDALSASSEIPAELAQHAGNAGIDIELSIYQVS
jgi:hypothetical protein